MSAQFNFRAVSPSREVEKPHQRHWGKTKSIALTSESTNTTAATSVSESSSLTPLSAYCKEKWKVSPSQSAKQVAVNLKRRNSVTVETNRKHGLEGESTLSQLQALSRGRSLSPRRMQRKPQNNEINGKQLSSLDSPMRLRPKYSQLVRPPHPRAISPEQRRTSRTISSLFDSKVTCCIPMDAKNQSGHGDAEVPPVRSCSIDGVPNTPTSPVIRRLLTSKKDFVGRNTQGSFPLPPSLCPCPVESHFVFDSPARSNKAETKSGQRGLLRTPVISKVTDPGSSSSAATGRKLMQPSPSNEGNHVNTSRSPSPSQRRRNSVAPRAIQNRPSRRIARTDSALIVPSPPEFTPFEGTKWMDSASGAAPLQRRKSMGASIKRSSSPAKQRGTPQCRKDVRQGHCQTHINYLVSKWLVRFVVIIQTAVRGYLHRRAYRTFLARRRRRQLRQEAATRLQAWIRSRWMRRDYLVYLERRKKRQLRHRAATCLQARVRAYLARDQCRNRLRKQHMRRKVLQQRIEVAVIIIQMAARLFLQRRKQRRLEAAPLIQFHVRAH